MTVEAVEPDRGADPMAWLEWRRAKAREEGDVKMAHVIALNINSIRTIRNGCGDCD